MSIQPDVQTEGYSRVQAVIDKAFRAQADLRPAFGKIVEQFEGEQEQVFAHSGAYGGRARWTSLSDAYAAWKMRAGAGGEPILSLTGTLARTLTDSDAPGAVREITRDSLVIGSVRAVGSEAKGYNLGFLHATGAGSLPRREAIRPTEQQDQRWADIIMENLFVEE